MDLPVIKSFSFDELSDKAKENAIEDYRQYVFQDDWWYQNTLDDATRAGEILGLMLTERHDAIDFSVWDSFSDFVVLSGTLCLGKEDVVRKIKEAFENGDEELLEIAKQVEAIEVGPVERVTSWLYGEDLETIPSFRFDRNKGVNTSKYDWLLERFADWIMARLRDDFNYMQSDENIADFLCSDKLLFDAAGNMF